MVAGVEGGGAGMEEQALLADGGGVVDAIEMVVGGGEGGGDGGRGRRRGRGRGGRLLRGGCEDVIEMFVGVGVVGPVRVGGVHFVGCGFGCRIDRADEERWNGDERGKREREESVL